MSPSGAKRGAPILYSCSRYCSDGFTQWRAALSSHISGRLENESITVHPLAADVSGLKIARVPDPSQHNQSFSFLCRPKATQKRKDK